MYGFLTTEYARNLPPDKIEAVLKIRSDLYKIPNPDGWSRKRVIDHLKSEDLQKILEFVESLMKEDAASIPHDRISFFGLPLHLLQPDLFNRRRLNALFFRAEITQIARSHPSAHASNPSNVMTGRPEGGLEIDSNNSQSGFRYFEVEDQHKTLFSDAMQGFAEFAKLKGYNVSIAVDSAREGMVGIKITIADTGITVATSAVKRDVDEYIAKLRRASNLDDMPIVIDAVEHQRLASALTSRFLFLKHQAEQYKMQSIAYQRMFEAISISSRSIGYAENRYPINLQVISSGDGKMTGDKYRVDHSPGAAVGVGNSALIEGSSLIIGSNNEQARDQSAAVHELTELIKASRMDISIKDSALRHLENIKEELSSPEKADPGLIKKSLDRLRAVLDAAKVGVEIYKKASDVFTLFGLAG